ncbi:hypothetical protein [Candidatus Endomicrobiellum pyrsonymphae]|uniref:hypothetical protein n=1 Tax=Candidatus Endomicrobiellum pyrsonymphae TaxID=1408203 RepID=UPI0035A8EA4B
MGGKTLPAHLEYPTKLQKTLTTFGLRIGQKEKLAITQRLMSNYVTCIRHTKDLLMQKMRIFKTIELNYRNINARKKRTDLYEKLGNKDKAPKEWLEIRGVDCNDIHAKSHDVHKKL